MTAQPRYRGVPPEGRPGPAPRQDTWGIIGPGGGGTMLGPTISPHDPNLVLEHCDMTGAYITTDGAMSWRMFNLRSVVEAFAFDPNDPEVIYASNEVLWRSEDRGRTWGMIFPDPAENTVEHMGSDHADWFVTTDDPEYPWTHPSIEAIAVDPADSRRIYLAVSGDPGVVVMSPDRGVSWSPVGELGAGQILAVCARRVGKLYIAQESGVYVMGAGGDPVQCFPAPNEARIVSAAIGEEKGELLVYATTDAFWKGGELVGGVQVFAATTESWRSAGADIGRFLENPGESRPPHFGAVACSAQHAAVAYLGFRRLRRGARPEEVGNGILKTTDAGLTWAIVHEESTQASDNLEVSWIEARAVNGSRNIWFDAPRSLGVGPTDPDVCYATDLFRTYRTRDGGRTWQQVNSVRVGGSGWTTRGLDVTTCYGVHFDPFDVSHMFITYTDIGLFRSEDGGRSWMGSTEGIPEEWRNTTYWVAFDPEVKDLIWGVFSGNHDLPRPKMWQGRGVGHYRGGVAVSRDGGRSWELSREGMRETAATDILLDPTSPVGQRTLYVCGFGTGVWKSTDNGRRWTLKNNGIEEREPFAWRITRADDGVLYLVVARRSDDGSIGTEEDGALYRSTDGAERWVRMALPEGCNGPNELTLDPTDSQRMYLSAWGRWVHPDDAGGGVFLSTDGGQNWENVLSRSQHVYDVTVDPRNPKVLYACGFDSAAYRSTDRGKTWARLRGYNFKWGHRVIPAPARARKIYITTFGGSVWYGPATGDAKAVEDISTPIRPGIPAP